MKYDDIKEAIETSKKYNITSVKEIGTGYQIRVDNGAIINCYNNGNYNLQGKNTQDIKNCLEGMNGIKSKNRKVFVVYGHNETATTQLEALLRRWDLEPIILDQKASGGQTIIEKLEEYRMDVGYAIVLATPDDEGKAKTEVEYKSRVRQNVVLELGMFLSLLGREKVAVLLKECDDFERPSDIHGLIYMPFQSRVDEVSINLIRELTRQGYNIESTRI